MMRTIVLRGLLCSVALCCAARAFAQEVDLSLREELAMKAAVARVAPSVVRIETVGGLDVVGKVLIGAGPTTGLVVSQDGYVISSAFNFIQKPTSVLVGLPDGTRTPAKIVARDHNRMLVLLKVETPEKLTPAEFVPEKEIRQGQWAIAVGRTFEADDPNISVGVVSAVRRVWGKAIQTDAKISPANYGGPLIDIQGRVQGVLVPLSPQGNNAVAGVEWYDSGIGFAIPLEHIQKVLPKLMAGEDLQPGLLGISMKPGDQYADPAVIASCRANSPAYRAGIKVGDTIIEIDGQPIVRQTQVKEQVQNRYAGETVKVVVQRDKERLTKEVMLVDKLETYQFPFLGLLPLRTTAADGSVMVRYVYPDSPAAKAGITIGDVVAAMDGKPLAGRADFAERVANLEADDKPALEIRRAGQTSKLELKPATLPESMPGELPPSRPVPAEVKGDRPQVGPFHFKIPEFENDLLAYVPENYDPEAAYGVVVWLSADGANLEDELLTRWKPLCDQHDLILLAPHTVEPKDAKTKRAWDPAKEVPLFGKALEHLARVYQLDRSRIVAHGYQGGAAAAYQLAFGNRDMIRAVAAIDAPLAGTPPENEPVYRLAYFTTTTKKAANLKQIEAGAARLRQMKYPVVVKDLGEQNRYLNDDELADLVRWIDTLDRI